MCCEIQPGIQDPIPKTRFLHTRKHPAEGKDKIPPDTLSISEANTDLLNLNRVSSEYYLLKYNGFQTTLPAILKNNPANILLM